MAPARPQRQVRSVVSYKYSPSDEEEEGARQEVMEQARGKRSLALKRSSRAQERGNAKDRAEAKQLERAISESLNTTCERTYRRGSVSNPHNGVQSEVIDLEKDRGMNDDSQSLPQPICMEGRSLTCEQNVGWQKLETLAEHVLDQQPDDCCEAAVVAEPPVPDQPSPGFVRLDNFIDAVNSSHVETPTDDADGPSIPVDMSNEAVCREGDQVRQKPSASRRGKGPNICRPVRNGSDDDWFSDEESQSDEDEDEYYLVSDDSDCGKGGAQKKRRTVQPAAKRPGPQLKQAASKTTPLKTKQISPKDTPRPAGDRGKTGKTVEATKIVDQDHVSAGSKGFSMESPKTAVVAPTSQSARLPLKPLNRITTPSTTTVLPSSPGSGPPLQFPSTQHRRVLGLSKRFQPPPLHPYLKGM